VTFEDVLGSLLILGQPYVRWPRRDPARAYDLGFFSRSLTKNGQDRGLDRFCLRTREFLRFALRGQARRVLGRFQRQQHCNLNEQDHVTMIVLLTHNYCLLARKLIRLEQKRLVVE